MNPKTRYPLLASEIPRDRFCLSVPPGLCKQFSEKGMTFQFVTSILAKWNSLVHLVGLLAVLAMLARLVVWVLAMTRKIDLSAYKYRDGAWALITGATDGIGLGFAQVITRFECPL